MGSSISGGGGGGGSSGTPTLYVSKPAADVTRVGNAFGSLSTAWTITIPGVTAGQAIKLDGSVAGRCSANEQFGFRLRRTSGVAATVFTTQFPNVAAANVMFQAPLAVVDTGHGGGDVTYEVQVAATSAGSTVTVTVGASNPSPYTYPNNNEGESMLCAQVFNVA
jgi:hypothetical protein